MSKQNVLFALILLTINLLACKNEPASTDQTAPATATTEAGTTPAPASGDAAAGGSTVSIITKESITLKDGSTIPFPKEGDKESIVYYFATPGQSKEGATSLSDDGQTQGNRLSGTMAMAGLTIVYVEGNAAMQTALGTAKANQAELNIFKAEKAEETLKLLAHNYLGKKVMVVASSATITQMMNLLTGKTTVSVPVTPNNNLYVVTAKEAYGTGDLKLVQY